MLTQQYLFDGNRKFGLASVDPGSRHGLAGKPEGLALLEKNKQRIEAGQARLFAEGTQALLVVLQAMDAAGKDGTVKHVFSGVNPQAIHVANFKGPTKEDLMHDYLWRVHKQVPPRGMIGIFNRSYYEDVLIGRVLDLPKTQPLPACAQKGLWKNRYRQIRDFERYLSENGITLVKVYLNLSKEEQRQRLLARLDDPDKNWKFEAGDLETRKRWDEYMRAYRTAINETAAPHAPWYVVPADHKWYARAVISQLVADALDGMCPQVPKVGAEQAQHIAAWRAELEDK